MKINILISTILLWSYLVIADPAPVNPQVTWEHSVSNGVLFGVGSKHLSELNLNHESFNFEYILFWGYKDVWTNNIVAMNRFFSNLYSNNYMIMTIESDWDHAFPGIKISLTDQYVYTYAISRGIEPSMHTEEPGPLAAFFNRIFN